MIKIAPVRKQVTVMASQQRAFDWFTQEMSRWWAVVLPVPRPFRQLYRRLRS